METFFTSDLHFGHKNIIEYCNRPFGSVEHMNAELIRRWNEVVGPDDFVWVLGDVAMGKLAETLPLVGQLNGKKFLLPGNHDRCWVGHSKKGNWAERYVEAGFTGCFSSTNEIVFDQAWKLPFPHDTKACHFPYEGDSKEGDRYQEWRPADEGGWLIHGHVHDKWKVNGRMINVGTDVWDYTPVHVDELSKVMTSNG